ncbi:hypothetical protein STANM309S_00643 [Streptomyces tanashiensis]
MPAPATPGPSPRAWLTSPAPSRPSPSLPPRPGPPPSRRRAPQPASPPATTQRALRTPALLQQWAEDLERWGKEDAVVISILTDPGLVEASLQPAADPSATARALQQAETRLKDTARHPLRQAAERVTALTELAAGIEARLAGLEPLQQSHRIADRLASIASANSAANTLSMELEAYVLAARLEEIAAAANTRLQSMTSERYLLVDSDEKEAGRRGRLKGGLGLRVLDTWTGTERETSTLSGGETFTASLALALGLADVVTQEASGRPLGTLFDRRRLRHPRRAEPPGRHGRPRPAPRG